MQKKLTFSSERFGRTATSADRKLEFHLNLSLTKTHFAQFKNFPADSKTQVLTPFDFAHLDVQTVYHKNKGRLVSSPQARDVEG